ncbi:MAG: hypothetical protein LKJ75_05140 [Clostridia bacterium]|jgi:hypothetical protein|nr:hypothetical protein [Clostridia bacterium]MCI2014568.1 hypothetical protein [Clostridia bacterium]
MPTGAGDEEKPYLYTDTEDLKMVADYSRLNFNECLELNCYTYKCLVRDAFIYKMRKTEKGIDYLETCWLLQQTQPDRKKLREKFGS